MLAADSSQIVGEEVMLRHCGGLMGVRGTLWSRKLGTFDCVVIYSQNRTRNSPLPEPQHVTSQVPTWVAVGPMWVDAKRIIAPGAGAAEGGSLRIFDCFRMRYVIHDALQPLTRCGGLMCGALPPMLTQLLAESAPDSVCWQRDPGAWAMVF